MACFFRNNKITHPLQKWSEPKTARDLPQGEFEMTVQKSDKAEKRPTANLIEQYRPLGLKAVLAAALQLKPKPKKKPQTA
jgi:hypothetical protein